MNASSVSELLDVSVSSFRKVPHTAHNFIPQSQFWCVNIVMVKCKTVYVVQCLGRNFSVTFASTVAWW